MSLLNVAAWIDATEVEGPGRRFALWVQGCNIRCAGCCNQHMFEFVPKLLVECSDVVAWLQRAKVAREIEGVTFLGGEPMLQARGLAEVAKAAQGMGLSVMVFTGFRLEQLYAMTMPGVDDLMSLTDVLVDGPYVSRLPDRDRRWVGSTNQRLHFLTNRYASGIERDPGGARGIEVRVRTDERVIVNGWPTGLEPIASQSNA